MTFQSKKWERVGRGKVLAHGLTREEVVALLQCIRNEFDSSLRIVPDRQSRVFQVEDWPTLVGEGVISTWIWSQVAQDGIPDANDYAVNGMINLIDGYKAGIFVGETTFSICHKVISKETKKEYTHEKYYDYFKKIGNLLKKEYSDCTVKSLTGDLYCRCSSKFAKDLRAGRTNSRKNVYQIV